MSTHSGIQLILIGLFLLGGFAAVLTALLRRNRNPRAVPALVAVVAFLFLCLGSVVMVLVQTMQNSGMVCSAHPDSGGHALRDGLVFAGPCA